MEKQTKVPKLRFPGFTGEWEQKKLRDIANRVTRKNNNNESSLPLTISAQYGLVDQETFFAKRVASRDISGYYLMKKGEFAYNKSYSDGYPFGVVKRLDQYEMGVLSTLYIVFYIKENGVNSDFLATYYDTGIWNREIAEYAAEGARNHGLLNISSHNFFNMKIIVPPTFGEQEKIAKFIQKIDSLINLYQLKLTHLQKKKKSLLQKMFPKKGERFPELRFPGFIDAWEKRKLMDKVDFIGTGSSKFIVKDYGNYEILGSTSVIGYDDTYDYEGDFLLTARVGANAGELYRYFGKVKISDNTVFIKADNLDFVYYLLTNFNIKKLSFGTGQPLVKASELKKLELILPLDDKEQKKIGNLFKSIDTLITLHQRKLSHLKKQKQALLQQMFV